MASDKPPSSRPPLRAIDGGRDPNAGDIAEAVTEPVRPADDEGATRGPLDETLEATHTYSPSGELENVLTARQRAIAALGAAGLKQFSADAFRIDSEVDRGGMGRVLLAADQRLGRAVALKQLLPGGGTRQARFIREMLITARLQHPNIVPIYEAGRWEGHGLVYSMRKVDGQSLRERLAHARDLESRLALLPNLIAATDAIDYAHSEGIVHRDIKPANVILGDFGETIVIDWGLAKAVDENSAIDAITGDRASPVPRNQASEREEIINTDLTAFGSVVGTPRYMSPEQALGEPVGTPTDVYALGACLYELLSGVAPFADQRSELVLDAVTSSEPRAPDEIVDNLPAELCAVTRVAMARDPELRYSARELADELRRYQAGALVGAHEYSVTELLGRWLRRNRVAVVVGAIAVLVLAVLAVVGTARLVAEKRRTQDALEVSLDRNDELLIAEAERLADSEPLAALQRLADLSPSSSRWDSARAIAAVAARRGIPVGVTQLPETAEELQWVDGVLIALGAKVAWRINAASGETVSVALPEASRREREGRVIGFDGEWAVVVNVLTGEKTRLTEIAVRPEVWATSAGDRFVAFVDERGIVIRDRETASEAIADARPAVAMAFSPTAIQLAAIVVQPDGTHAASMIEPNKPAESPLPDQAPGNAEVSWSPDGEVAYLHFGNGFVVGYQYGNQALSMNRSYPVTSVSSHRGGYFAVATIDRQVIIHKRGHHRLSYEVRGLVHAIKFAPGGGTLAIAGGDGQLHHWSYLSNAAHAYPHPRPVRAVSFGATDDIIYTLATDRWVRKFRVARRETMELESLNPFGPIASPEPRLTALLGAGGVLALRGDEIVFHASGGKRVIGALAAGSRDIQLAASDSGSWAAIASRGDAGGELRFWSPDLREPTVIELESPIAAMSFATGARELITGHQDGSTRVWPAADGTSRALDIHDDSPPSAVAMRGQRVAIARAGDPSIFVHGEGRDGESEPRALRAHVGDVKALVFSPDGSWLASASADLDLRVWNPDTGEGERLGAHTSVPTAMVFSPDSSSIGSVSAGEAFVWDVASGLAQIVLSVPYDVTSIRFDDKRSVLMSNGYVVFESTDDVPRDVGKLRRWIAEAIAASPARE